MSNTVITNYTDLNGPSTKADSSVVVIVNKDGSLSVDQKLLGTLMGTDGSQAAGISVVRVGHEGKPDDATDSESDDDKVPHVTLSVDSYYDEPNSIIKYDSGAEMLQSLRIETRENSLIGFQNDHCYTPFTSPSQTLPQNSESYNSYDDPVIEITHTPPPKPVPNSKKITILEQKIIPKGKKILINPSDSPIILKGNDVLSKPLPVLSKSKHIEQDKGSEQKSDENTESSSISSGDSIPDRDSDSDYKETKDRSGSLKVKKSKLKPRILKNVQAAKPMKLDPKVASRLKSNKAVLKKEIREKGQVKITTDKKVPTQSNDNVDIESLIPKSAIALNTFANNEQNKSTVKQTPKSVKKEKKTPAHYNALLSDMTSLFSTPDVIRRVSTDNKTPGKSDILVVDKKAANTFKTSDTTDLKSNDSIKALEEHMEKTNRGLCNPTRADMDTKIVVFICMACMASASVVPVARLDPLPQYSYGYDVQDSLTGDYKGHQENRNGDLVTGSYSVVDPDGTRRIVDYAADPINGFNAVVRREPLVVPAPARVVAPAPLIAPAPLAPAPLIAPAPLAPAPLIAPAPIVPRAPVFAPASAPLFAPRLPSPYYF